MALTDVVDSLLGRKLLASSNTNTMLNGANAAERALESTRDGALFTASLQTKLGLMGRIFAVSCGSVTTPLTFLVTAANRPDWVLRVPSGTTLIPICVETVLEAAAGTATEIDIRLAQNDLGNGTSSAATAGPINTRTDVPVTSLVTARQLYTGDATAETNPVSLHRRCFPLAQASGLIPYEDFWTPEFGSILVVGPSSLEGFVAATTTQATGFVVIRFAEVPSGWVTG